jgi:hypothetical protein
MDLEGTSTKTVKTPCQPGESVSFNVFIFSPFFGRAVVNARVSGGDAQQWFRAFPGIGPRRGTAGGFQLDAVYQGGMAIFNPNPDGRIDRVQIHTSRRSAIVISDIRCFKVDPSEFLGLI